MNVAAESFKHFKKYLWGFITVILLGFLVDFSISLVPLTLALLIDRVITPALGGDSVKTENLFGGFLDGIDPNQYWTLFSVVAAIFLGLIISRYIANYIRWVLAQYAGTRVEASLRDKAFRKVITQNSVVMSRYTSGELISMCNSDIVTLKDFYATQISIFCGVLVFWTLGSYFLFTINPVLMILPICGGITTFIIMRWHNRAARVRHDRIRNARIKLNTTVQENIQGVRVVRSYATEDIEMAKFNKDNDAFNDSFVIAIKNWAKYNTIFIAIRTVVFYGSMLLSIWLALEGKMTVGQYATFFAYITLIVNPFEALANIFNQLQNAVIAGDRLFTFLNTSNAIVDGVDARDIVGNPIITVNDCSVQIDEKILIKDINLNIEYGKKLGIMGKTGSGKTSFIKSLGRFYEVTKGEICINGVDIKNLKVDDVRRQYSYVMQDVFLFSDTVANNIAFYDPSSSQELIEKAAKIAEAHEFVIKLSDGYNTIIGEKGIGLSGGQRQRISIARALLKNAPILLFDDCTSALDMETEKRILQAIKDNYPEKSIILASHRATSVENCDEIIYFEQGQIIERGSHTQLMNTGGKYATVYNEQEAARLASKNEFIG